MTKNKMLVTYFAGSILLAIGAVFQMINFLSTDEVVMQYFFELLGVFWAIMALMFGLDIFKGDYIVIKAKVINIRRNRVWFEWETGRKTSVSVNHDVLKRLLLNKNVELLLTKRTKQLKDIRV